MFGSYLHSLSAHAPQQYELVCLKSINTENQEHLFRQARQIVSTTTNRQPQNIIPSALLRLQAKNEYKQIQKAVHKADSQVRSAASNLPTAGRTMITHSFLQDRMPSWQAHLHRISPFLLQGRGVWWEAVESGYLFHDGDTDVESHCAGPVLHHLRSST